MSIANQPAMPAAAKAKSIFDDLDDVARQGAKTPDAAKHFGVAAVSMAVAAKPAEARRGTPATDLTLRQNDAPPVGPSSGVYVSLDDRRPGGQSGVPGSGSRGRARTGHGDNDWDQVNLSRLGVSPALFKVNDGRISRTQELVAAKNLHDQSAALVTTIIEDIRSNRELDLTSTSAAVEEMVASITRNPDPLVWLTHLKKQDSYSYTHGIDCAIHMMAFGRHLSYPAHDLHILGMSGLLQDVGKLHVPQELLLKNGPLTGAELGKVKLHVMASIDILRQTPGISTRILETIAQHHERMDGSGYPLGLVGDEITPFAAMAAIVDCFEALTSNRPYAKAKSIHEALLSLKFWQGKCFHSALVEQFGNCIGIYPVGTLVELNSGEVGVVVGQNRDLRLKPTVMLIRDRDKNPHEFPPVIDLRSEPVDADGTTYHILRDLPPGSYDIDESELFL